MKRFRRRQKGYQTRLEPVEATILESLLAQFIDLLSDVEASDDPASGGEAAQAPDPMDPFAQWEAEIQGPQAFAERPTDPVLLRLFPDAYADPEEAAEFRRFTQDDQRETKIAEAELMLRDVVATREGAEVLHVAPPDVMAWLRTLNALRLVLATRLGITADLPEGDPDPAMPDHHAFMSQVYHWLAFAQESLLDVL